MEKQAPASGFPMNHQQPYGPYPPPHMPLMPPGDATWSSGLCDCCHDVPRCCLTCWCPCITFGQIAEIADKGTTSCGTAGALYGLLLAFTGCQWIYSCTYRTKMRLEYGIQGDQLCDCCTHFWCECCALSQMHNELTARGYNVPLGWHGNVGKQYQGVHMPPTAPSGMTR